MRALVAAAVLTIAAPASAAPKLTTASLFDGHVTIKIPPGWESGAFPSGGEGVAKGTTMISVFVLPGSPDALLDLVEAAEADTIVYTDRGFGMLAGIHVIAAPGKTKSGKGGGRSAYVGATCLGTIVIVSQWEDGAPAKDRAELEAAMRTLAYDVDRGSMFVGVAHSLDKLDAAARRVAETFANATCLGATRFVDGLAAASIEVDGRALDRKAFDDAVTERGDLASYLRMTSGVWSASTDPDNPKAFVVTRVPTKELGVAEATTAVLFEQVDGAWKLTKIKRAAP